MLGTGVVVTSESTQKPKSNLRNASGGLAKLAEKTYVLDTSVLLSDPKAIFRFAEHSVVLPVIVITELESKRNDPEIGYFARQALRNLDELRVQHERLDFPIAVWEDGGSLRVELNHSNMAVLPSGLQLGDNDSRILAVAEPPPRRNRPPHFPKTPDPRRRDEAETNPARRPSPPTPREPGKWQQARTRCSGAYQPGWLMRDCPSEGAR